MCFYTYSKMFVSNIFREISKGSSHERYTSRSLEVVPFPSSVERAHI